MTLVLILEYNVNFITILKKEVNNGVCECEKKCGYLEKSVKKATKNKCVEISFMIFRTGSILIVGHCDENILNIVYMNILKNIIRRIS